MTDQLLHTGFNFYQNANADAESVKANFIVRLHEYDIISGDLRRHKSGDSVQHYLLLGRRGSGKSTLLRRLQVAMETEEDLQARYLAINLAEEQANMYRLFDLLEVVREEMLHQQIPVAAPVYTDDPQAYARNLFAVIHAAIAGTGKQLVLLIDNIDRILENLGDEGAILREHLLNFSDIKIIGGSTRMTEHFWKYNQPFYQFFRVLELKPLSSEEIKTLLLNWGDNMNLPALTRFVREKPGQLETIRILTDGLPRTLQFFVNLLLTNSQESGYEYLRKIMDLVTPLYQERLNNLPPSQRKIILQLAFIWEATGTKELVEATRMDTRLISAQMKKLVEKGVVEQLNTETKNYLYRLAERFFNLWLIFTQGSPKEKRRAKYLTLFLENFYSAHELQNLALEHVGKLQSGALCADKAVILTKALSQSKYLTWETRDMLIEKTLSLTDMSEELRSQLPPTTRQQLNEIEQVAAVGNYADALAIAEIIEGSDGIRELSMGYLYALYGRKVESESFFLQAIEKGSIVALFNLAHLYQDLGRMVESESYYLQAIEKGNTDALNNLANLYLSLGRTTEAESYYLQAVEKGYVGALSNLANLYLSLGRITESEAYYLQAIEKGYVGALSNLANLYQDLGRTVESESYYLQAIERGNVGALGNLANLYQDLGRTSESESYYLQAIEKGDLVALFNLANLYRGLGRSVESESYYLQAIEKGDIVALNNLAILYQDLGRTVESESYYLQAIEKGYTNALFNLASLYHSLGRTSESENYYLQAINKGNIDALFNLAILYHSLGRRSESEAYYLQAIEKGHIGALNNLAILYQGLGRVVESENYYLQAIEKGDIDALNNLAILYQGLGRVVESENYYLQAIEKGDVGALNNLAILYHSLGRRSESEAYYLQAIEKGHIDALNNLADLYRVLGRIRESEKYFLLYFEKEPQRGAIGLCFLYYQENTSRERIAAIVQDITYPALYDFKTSFSIIIALWKGELKTAATLLPEALNPENRFLAFLLEQVLVHYQYQLALQYFESPETGVWLKEQYQLIYYVTNILAGRSLQSELIIPPELLESVEKIVVEIQERQNFYYPQNV